MDDLIFRHENKYMLNNHDRTVLQERVKRVLRPDEHSNPDASYKIRSLYFDSPDDTALSEKLTGISRREKFRIRRYNDNSTIFLERKFKLNGLTAKESVILPHEVCDEIITGKYSSLLSMGETAVSFYAKLTGGALMPKCLVDYTRYAYTYPVGNVRITFDCNIKSGLSSTDFFNSDVPTYDALPKGMCVFEVKYDRFIPEFILDLIQTGWKEQDAVSKYAFCRLIMM